MCSVYIEYYLVDTESKCYVVPLSSMIVAFVAQWTLPYETALYKGGRPNNHREQNGFVNIVLNKINDKSDQPVFNIPDASLQPFSPRIVGVSGAALPYTVQMCALPSVVLDTNGLCISGLCSVLRHILKVSKEPSSTSLLGFRGSCLMACAEVSIWTKFCEVDLFKSTMNFISNARKDHQLPVDLLRFESHMERPLRTHNIGKKEHHIRKEFLSLHIKEKTDTKSSSVDNEQIGPVDCSLQMGTLKGLTCSQMEQCARSEKSLLSHNYAEDVVMTLADLVILVCVHHILVKTRSASSSLHSAVPAVLLWYRRMTSDLQVKVALLSCGMTPVDLSGEIPEAQTSASSLLNIPNSLYKRDVDHHKQSSKVYTKQIQVEAIVNKLKKSSIIPEYTDMRPCDSAVIDWTAVHEMVHPSFGDMPANRLARKCQQLENMVTAVRSIVSDGDIIVDFCSGGGHLGILLAYLLPKCQVIMIENKEASVDRAVRRRSSLTNAIVIQCNLDYFQGQFNVGVALHACGVATDLVLQRCIDVGASFAICPCCYGGLHDIHLLSYPRSQQFYNVGITSEEYYYLGHAADQTQTNSHKYEQGKYCMGLVDTDRKCAAEYAGYNVSLFKMTPASCTPKNNILVGRKYKEILP